MTEASAPVPDRTPEAPCPPVNAPAAGDPVSITDPRSFDAPRGERAADDGLLVVDKPAGWTSHDVVARVRRMAATKKVGHAGTLDPMATGVLVLGVGRATRLLTYLVGARKTYRATIRLGQNTVTDDAEGAVTSARGAEDVGPGRVAAAMEGLRGDLAQVPSAVSAIKVNGQRAYNRVRAGEDVALAARPVTVTRFEPTAPPRHDRTADDTEVVDLDVIVECSSGTYIRALARDLGAALGTGGHLTALRRERVGVFTLTDAATLPELARSVCAEGALSVLTVTDACTRIFSVRRLDEAETTSVRVGRHLSTNGSDDVVAALASDGHVLALLQDRDGRARPVLVFDPA